MEEIKTYIESGILELYIMGDLSPDERCIVEMMAAKYPEIKEELSEIEKALEGYADTYAIAPDAHLRDRIIKSLSAKKESILAENDNASVVTMPFSSSSGMFYKYAFAASVAILLLSWSALFILYTRLETSAEQIAILQASNQKFASQVKYIDKQLQDSKQTFQVFGDPDFKIVKLKGTKNSPASSILVAFNPKMQDVMIDMSGMNIPANDAEHQYQLWALVDGNPRDLGVFDMTTDSMGMKKMRSIGYAEAFAVTLEKRGGSVSPTMEQMMVFGSNLKI